MSTRDAKPYTKPWWRCPVWRVHELPLKDQKKWWAVFGILAAVAILGIVLSAAVNPN